MKCITVRKNTILKLGALTVALATAIIACVSVLASENRELPIYCVKRTDKKIAISFDAAWGADDTDTLISILGKYKVKATFFVVGQWVDNYPEEVKKLHNAGHDVENHSATHPYMTRISKEEMSQEIKLCNDKIKEVTGETPNLFRCPYGDYDNNVIETVESLKMYPIQWSVDSLDWKDSSTADSIANRVISNVKDGSIILCHNDAEYTPDALPTILKTLQEQGYKFVLINDLIMKKDYNIDTAGQQYSTKQ